MKMYNAQMSPYAARCRILIYAKGADVELAGMPDAITWEGLAKLTPMHKIPTLDVDGFIVPESQLICEYLEQTQDGTSLLPEGAKERVAVRLIGRIVDLYVLPHLGELFGQINPKDRHAQSVAKCFEELEKAIGWLDFYLDGSQYAHGDGLTMADCALVPALYYIDKMPAWFGRDDLLTKGPNVKAYFEKIADDPHVARVLTEIDEAMKKMQAA